MNGMKFPKAMVVLLVMLGLLSVCVGAATVINQPLQPVTRVPVTLQLAPQITMERGALESPQGMNIYEIKILPIQTEVLQRFSSQQGLIVKQIAPITQLRRMRISRIYTEKEGIGRMLLDEQRGHMIILPRAELLAKSNVQLLSREVALNSAQLKLNELKLIPQDVSKIIPNQVITLSTADLKPGGQTVNSRAVMQTVLFQRTINEKPVVGNGSVLTLDLGNQGEVVGVLRNWNELLLSNIKPEFRADTEIYNEIEGILKQQIRGAGNVLVQRPRLVYFGDDQKYVQPAYFFSAAISDPKGVGKSYFSGFVSALKNSPERIQLLLDPKALPMPVLRQGTAEKPNLWQPGTVLAAGADPTVGRYVVRDDSSHWVGDANDFKNGLNAGHCGGCAAITFTDYYWDEPRFWTTQEASYVDKWNVVLMEGHGANWLFTTRSNCCDVVNLNAATQPGYGNNAGSSMRFLILKGCSIVPAPPDRANWADPWWRIFKGLRQAIGFRTSMYINDDIMYHYGYHIANNCRTLDSWFHATNGNSSYQWQRFWGGDVKGYGTVVMIPGMEGTGIYHTGAAAPATSTGLTIWWQH